jgi:hypothetical protein
MNTESAGMIFRSLKTKAAPDSNKADQLSKLKRSNFSNSDIVVKKKNVVIYKIIIDYQL